MGDDLLEELQQRVDIIRHKLKFIENKPTIACIEWLEPLMLSGNWVPELVGIAGGISILAEPGKHSLYVNWEDIRLQDPDILSSCPCGFAIERTLKEINILLQPSRFTGLKAVKNNRLFIADATSILTAPARA